MVETGKNLELKTFFNTLEEQDKDIVITLAESLVKKNNNMTNKVSNTKEVNNHRCIPVKK